MTPSYEVPKGLVALCNVLNPSGKVTQIGQGTEWNYIDSMRQHAQHFVFDIELTRREFYQLNYQATGEKIEMELGVFPLPKEQKNYLEMISKTWPGDLKGLIGVYEILAIVKGDSIHEKGFEHNDPLDEYEILEKPIKTADDFIDFLIAYIRVMHDDLTKTKIGLNKLKKEIERETRDDPPPLL